MPDTEVPVDNPGVSVQPANGPVAGVTSPAPAPAAPDPSEYDIDSAHDEVFDEPPSATPAPAETVSSPIQVTSSAPAPSHSPRIVQMALEMGLSDQDIQRSSPERLEERVYDLTRQLKQMAWRNQTQDTLLGVNDRPPQDRQSAPPAERPAPSSPTESDDFDLGDEAKDFDPVAISLIKKAARLATSKSEARIQQLQARLDQYEQREAFKEHMTVAEKIDATFNGLADPRLGKGSITEMAQDAPERVIRNAVVDTAVSLAKRHYGVDNRGRGKYTSDQLLGFIKKAHGLLYGQVPHGEGGNGPAPSAPAANPGEDSSRVLPPRNPANGRFTQQEWAEAGLARPTNRSGAPEPNGEAKALKTAAAIMKDQGLTDESDPGPEAFLE